MEQADNAEYNVSDVDLPPFTQHNDIMLRCGYAYLKTTFKSFVPSV